MQLGIEAQQSACNAITALIDLGSSVGRIEFFAGRMPAKVSEPDAGRVLVALKFGPTAFGPADTSGIAKAKKINPNMVELGGLVGHLRIKNSEGLVVCQGTVSKNNEGGDVQFDDPNFITGGECKLTELAIVVPAWTPVPVIRGGG